MSASVILRLAVIASVQAGVTLYMMLLGLILTTSAGRATSDVSLFAGLVAGLEVPFMLAVPMLLSRVSKSALIAGAALYMLGFYAPSRSLPASQPSGRWFCQLRWRLR